MSGKYIVFVINGKGKIYNAFNDNLLFEGEFIKGRKNGMGIEYGLFGNKIFQGKYINGMKNGFGKEYDSFDQLIFEGEYLNGKRWNGCEHDLSEHLTYELKNGKRFINNIEYKNEYIFNNENETINPLSSLCGGATAPKYG